MKKLLLILICSIYPTFLISYGGKWERIIESEQSTFFLDIENIIKEKNNSTFWILRNGGYDMGFISSKTYYQSDCSKMGLKTLDTYMFKGF